MKCFHNSVIHKAIPSRKDGYLEEVKKRNTSNNELQYCLEQEDIDFLKNNYRKEVMPSIVQMAKNAAQAGISEAKAIVNKQPPVDPEEEQRRLGVCAACEFYTPNIVELSEDKKKQNRCVKCGCFMNFKTKLRSAHCPVGKW